MRLSQELNDSMNEQILKEYHNSLVYAQIQSYFEDLQLSNLADYFKKQSIQESEHAQKFIKHLNDRTGGKVTIGEVNSPNIVFSSIEGIGDIYVSAEESTTESIEAIYELASSTKSFIDLPFLSEMLSEQIEEEDSANKLSLNIKSTREFVILDKLMEG